MAAQAIKGKNGFLFLTNDSNKIIDQITGKLVLNKAQIDVLGDILALRDDLLGDLSIPYKYLVVRNKEFVCKEYLPESIYYAKQTVFDQLISLAREKGVYDNFVIPELIQNEDGNPVFCKVDTHWTAYGVLDAFDSLMNAIYEDIPHLRKLPYQKITIEPYETHGDLGSKLTPQVVGMGYKIVPAARQFETYSNGVINIGMVRCFKNSNAPNKLRIVIFGNSFSNGDMLSLLALTFSEVYFFFTPNVSVRLIEDICPDYCVIQLLERFLVRVPTDDRGLSVFDYAAMKVLSGSVQSRNQVVKEGRNKYCSEDISNKDRAHEYLMNKFLNDFYKLPMIDRRELQAWLKTEAEFFDELMAKSKDISMSKMQREFLQVLKNEL